MIEWAGTVYALAKEAYGHYRDAKELYDAGKAVYEAGKDFKDHFEIKESDPKLVDFEWATKSGFQAKAEADGYQISWSRPERVASRELDGYEVMYEIDKNAKIKRKLVLYDGMVLIGRKKEQA